MSWTTDDLRHEASLLRRVGKKARFDTPYGQAEPATYRLCSEGMEWAADEIERLEAQVEALQNKCARRGLSPEDSDALQAENERLQSEREHYRQTYLGVQEEYEKAQTREKRIKAQQEQLEMDFGIDPVCKAHGCTQQQHLRNIRQLQQVIANLEEKLRGYEQG